MYLVTDQRHGTNMLVFTSEDPRKAGYKGDVVDNVQLDYNLLAVHTWREGELAPEACVGRDPNDDRHYKVFKYTTERGDAGYEPVDGTAVVFTSWSDYRRLTLIPPDAVNTEDEDWLQHLDWLDEEARKRQRRSEPDQLPSGNRDDVAAWVAKNHFLADSAIQEIWYLPEGAPADEIRLLELSDRFVGPDTSLAPIDFGLDVNGVGFRLYVADVSTPQLEEIKQDPSRLPRGWSLRGNKVYPRRRRA